MRWLSVSLLLVVGCQKQAATVPIVSQVAVKLVRSSPAELPQLGQPALESMVKEAVASVSRDATYRPAKMSASPGMVLKVKVDLRWEQPQAILRAEVTAQLEPREAAGALLPIERSAQLDKEAVTKLPTEADVRAHLQRALALTVPAAVAAEQLWLGPPAAIRQAIDSPDADLRDEAIRFCGERKDREALPQLIALLKREDGALRDRSIGALAAIGDPRAVKPLADLAKFGDLRELPKIMEAVSQVGGEEAEAYLEFIAGSHPVPEVQALARRALERTKADRLRR